MKKKSIIIVLIITILVILIGICLLTFNNREKMQEIFSDTKKQEIENGISYHVYEYKNNEGMMLVRIKNSENGIEKVTRPDGTTINCNGKRQVSIDQKIEKNGSYQFIAKTVSGETLDKTITMDDATIAKLMEVTYTEENTNLSININYDDYKNKYYKFSQDEEWTEYTGNFDILVENAANELNYDKENSTITIYLRGTDDIGNEVLTQKNLNIKAELPETNLIITTASGSGVDTKTVRQDIKNKLAKSNISAAFMDMSLGQTEGLSSNAQDARNNI